MSAIHSIANTAASQIANQAATSATANSQQSSVPFAGVFQSMVQDNEALSQKADDAVNGFMNGNGTELHDVMIATQKADMSFELALQVRNKAVAAYQQMMGMQF
jgi:flagellar hook-basal body complex protein FliE